MSDVVIPAGNPWISVTESPYVYKPDEALIEKHNSKNSGTQFEIKLEVYPDPFVGSPQAPIWLLNLNPGLDPRDYLHPQSVVEMQKASARLEAKNFWYLSDELRGTSGYDWWSKRLGKIIEEFGIESVKKSFFCVELFPYHSIKDKWASGLLPSQDFTVKLVAAAAAAGRSFIFMRKEQEWKKHVPALNSARTSSLKNTQSPWITRNNLVDATILDPLSS